MFSLNIKLMILNYQYINLKHVNNTLLMNNQQLKITLKHSKSDVHMIKQRVRFSVGSSL